MEGHYISPRRNHPPFLHTPPVTTPQNLRDRIVSLFFSYHFLKESMHHIPSSSKGSHYLHLKTTFKKVCSLILIPSYLIEYFLQLFVHFHSLRPLIDASNKTKQSNFQFLCNTCITLLSTQIDQLRTTLVANFAEKSYQIQIPSPLVAPHNYVDANIRSQKRPPQEKKRNTWMEKAAFPSVSIKELDRFLKGLSIFANPSRFSPSPHCNI